MRAGFVLIGLAVLTLLVVDAIQLLSPVQVVQDFRSLSAGLSGLEALAFAQLLLGSGVLAMRGEGTSFFVSALCSAGWCIGWLHWNINHALLPVHSDLVSFAAIVALCVGLSRWCRGPWRLLLALASLLALAPFVSAVLRGTGTASPAAVVFSAEILGELALLIALRQAAKA